MKKFILNSGLVILMFASFAVLSPMNAEAAPPPTTTTSTTTTTTTGGAVPVEGGLGALAMLLASYAAVRMRKNVSAE